MTTPRSDNGPTPGDWRAEYSEIWAGDFVIATVHWEHFNDPHHEANVRYLAAAKEAIEALEGLAVHFHNIDPAWRTPVENTAVHVIAKAKGESNAV